jgi:hypothetical protein
MNTPIMIRSSLDYLGNPMPTAQENDESYTKIVLVEEFRARLINNHNYLNQLANQVSSGLG